MQHLLVATRKGLFEYEETKNGWAVVNRSFIGDHCFLAMRDPRAGMTLASLGHGGKTFEQLRCGLLQNDGWDIVLRHALDASASGRTVVFGSATGNLYVSNDQGDSFNIISHSLPPMYAVHLFERNAL